MRLAKIQCRRGPDRRRTTAGDRWAGSPLRTQAFVAVARSSGLRSRRAQASPLPSSPVVRWIAPLLPLKKKSRRNRRAPGALAGGKHGCDERSRSEQTGSSPVGGDRKIADVSAVNRRHCRIKDAIWAIWVICGQFARAGGRPSCLCVFVFAMSSVFFSVSLSVPLWFTRWAATKKGLTPALPVLPRGACRTSAPTRSGLFPRESGRSQSGVRSR